MAGASEPEGRPLLPGVFLDTSVLFAAVLSETGGSRLILKLGEAGAVRLLVSRQVLGEADGVLRRKAADVLPVFSLLLDCSNAQVVSTAARKEVLKWVERVGHPGDAQILADAMLAKADYLVTLDKAHLLGNRALARAVPFPIGTPGDFLAWVRARLLQ